MNTRQTAALQHRNPDVDAENCFYDHANCLHEGPNVSHKRKPWYERWWVITLQLLVIAAAILCCMNEVGCFDR